MGVLSLQGVGFHVSKLARLGAIAERDGNRRVRAQPVSIVHGWYIRSSGIPRLCIVLAKSQGDVEGARPTRCKNRESSTTCWKAMDEGGTHSSIY